MIQEERIKFLNEIEFQNKKYIPSRMVPILIFGNRWILSAGCAMSLDLKAALSCSISEPTVFHMGCRASSNQLPFFKTGRISDFCLSGKGPKRTTWCRKQRICDLKMSFSMILWTKSKSETYIRFPISALCH